MKLFTKQEAVVTTLIFLVVFAVTAVNMNTSLRRARDAQRKGDLGAITDALEKFQNEFGFVPPSDNGKIKMCKGSNFDEVVAKIKGSGKFDMNIFVQGLRTCEWGQDALGDIMDETAEPYMKTIPSDPRAGNGISYIYLSNSNRFQLYTYLEGEEDESGYDKKIVERKLGCGVKTCSFGKSYAVPVDISIEEYERELIKKNR